MRGGIFIKNVIKKIRVLYIFPLFMILTGCSQVNTDSDLYQKISNQTSQLSENVEAVELNGWAWLSQKAYSLSNTLKGVAPFVIVGSILFGFLLIHIIDKDQAIRKKAIQLFFIIIPVAMFILTYGVAYLCGTFS